MRKTLHREIKSHFLPKSAAARIGVAVVAVGLFALLWNTRKASAGAAEGQSATDTVWPSEAPAGCPFEKSTEITGIAFTGRHTRYGNADTWYPSWAANGNLYSSWTDGRVNHVKSISLGPKPTTGYATILGDDPLHLEITDVGTYPGNPAPYEGRYPCANLIYNGVWYYGTYCVTNSDPSPKRFANWDVLGPFVGFRYSADYGKSWHDTSHTPSHPLFGEPARKGGKLKMGAPHFVDFGKNMQYSPDGRAYLVAHGAVDPDPQPRYGNLSWISGDRIYMARVEPGIHNVDNRARYEFFAGYDGRGQAVWTREFSKIKPLVDWNNNCGCVTMTYNAPLKKYMMCITDGGNGIAKFHTYIVESEHVAGPWKLVVYMHDFGEQAYFVNIPSKFISPDGRTAWLCYAANYTNGYLDTPNRDIPPGGGYAMTLQEVKFLQ